MNDNAIKQTDTKYKIELSEKAKQISENQGIKIDLYVEELYSEEGLSLYYSPYELHRNAIEYLYDEETNSFIFQTWLGNIACSSSEKNKKIIGEPLYDIVKNKNPEIKPALNEKLEEDLEKNDPFYNLDFNNVPKNLLPQYLNLLLSDFSAKLDEDIENLKGSCLFFQFNSLIDISLNHPDLNNDNEKLKIIGALKQCKQQAAPYLDITNLTVEEVKNISLMDLTDKLVDELNEFQLNSAEGRRELYRYLASFSSTGYSTQNQLLIRSQCSKRQLEPNAVGTFNEWKSKKTSIKPGEKAMYILIPSIKTYYYKYDADGTPIALPNTHDKNELKLYEKLIEEGTAYKHSYTNFHLLPRVFSISQTTMKESERPLLLQRYNSENDSEKNNMILIRIKNLTNQLGVEVQETEGTGEALGFFTNNKKHLINVNKELPVDAKIWTMLHELGHFVLHGKDNIPSEIKLLSTAAKEVQAELFANITAEGLGIDSEKAFSSSYIDSFLKVESGIPGEYDFLEINKQHLLTHLKIIEPAIKTIGTCLQQESALDSQLQEITNFVPSLFEINPITTYAQAVKLTEVTKTKTMEFTKEKAL